jgi:hypothetical protein
MYVAVVAIIVGQALALGRPALLLYAAVLYAAAAGFAGAPFVRPALD